LSDFEILDAAPKPKRTHGGARANSGPKPKGYEKPTQVVDYEVAKARKESALADLHELDYKVKSQEYVARAAVRQAVATAMATLVQSMRSLSDNLERNGVPTDVCLIVENEVNEALANVGRDLKMFTDETE